MLFAAAVVCIPALLLNQRGHYVPASVTATVIVLIAIVYNLYQGHGIHDSAVVAVPIFVMFGPLLFGRRALPLFLVLGDRLSGAYRGPGDGRRDQHRYEGRHSRCGLTLHTGLMLRRPGLGDHEQPGGQFGAGAPIGAQPAAWHTITRWRAGPRCSIPRPGDRGAQPARGEPVHAPGKGMGIQRRGHGAHSPRGAAARYRQTGAAGRDPLQAAGRSAPGNGMLCGGTSPLRGTC